jgi:starch phosphorylase
MTAPFDTPAMTPRETLTAALPPRIAGLTELAFNLSWSWNSGARELFASIDSARWHTLCHNPITLLQTTAAARLHQLAEDTDFLARYDRAMEWLVAERSDALTWFARGYPHARGQTIAYFCAEFGFHNSVPIYSGGLGVLAGDHCKAASDLGVPLVGVGIFYRDGYFDQEIRPDGWQEDAPDSFALSSIPITQVVDAHGEPVVVTVRTFDRDVRIRAWRLDVGRVPIYLLDSDLPDNHEDDRPLLSKLYAGGPATRLRQEWLLGVGGVRLLRALDIEPAAWHANEGHAGFMMTERVAELTRAGHTATNAIRAVRDTTVFTTHTPVPAGHDHFDVRDVDACASSDWAGSGLSTDTLLALGAHPEAPGRFHMTALCLRLSRRVNGVSEPHGHVSRALCAPLWPGRAPTTVPVRHVTNGVHLATWMAQPMIHLLTEELGDNWGHHRTADLWERVLDVDEMKLWRTHRHLKNILHTMVRERARHGFAQHDLDASQLAGSGVLLDPDVLTIGFARRFASYKRANLLLRDVDRLRALVTNSDRPVQLVFSGKAHPADIPGKTMLQDVYQYTRDPSFQGRIVFLEDYGMHLAHLLVQGVDLWLNLPRVPLEASGTSGMKAALNGVPQLSTLDGWWVEAYDGTNGWAIEPELDDETGAATADRAFELLEQDIVPRYYTRNADHLPMHWVPVMKHAIRVAGSRFTARRMVEQYAREYYVPSVFGDDAPDDPPTL